VTGRSAIGRSGTSNGGQAVRRLAGRLVLLAVLLAAGSASVVATPAQHAQAATSSPGEWAKTCSAAALGIQNDDVELAPSLTTNPDTNPDGTPVAIQPDQRGKYVPVVMVHGWVSQDTHTPARDGTFSSVIDLTANQLGSAATTRSLIGQLQRVPGTAVFTFDYRDYAARWVDDRQLGGALGKVIDCLYRASGEKVIIVGHSMGGLIARYATNMPGVTGPDRSGEISTVVTFGTPETGSTAALLTDATANIASATAKPLAVLRLLLAQCGRLASISIQTGSLCDKLPKPVRTFDSDAGIALRAGSSQLAALKPFPPGVNVDALAGDATFDLPVGSGWFALPWPSVRVSSGDLIVPTGSALDKTATGGSKLTRTVSCAYQLNAYRGATDNVALAFGFTSLIDVPQQPLVSFYGPCFHTHLMRSIELTNEATGSVNDDVRSRQPGTPAQPLRVTSVPIPKIGLPNYETSGSYPQVSGGSGVDVTAVNAALRDQVLRDQEEYRQADRRAYGTELDNKPDPGQYQMKFSPTLMSASTVVVSTMYPSLELYPDGNDGEGWMYLTAPVPAGNPVELVDLLSSPATGLTAIAGYVTQQVVATSPCVARSYNDTGSLGSIMAQASRKGFAPTAENYRHFAFTLQGLDIGLDQGQVGVEGCGAIRTTVPWSIVRPQLNATGLRLVDGLR